jgi:hypothetical protein
LATREQDISMTKFSVDEGYRGVPPRYVDQATAAICQQGRGGGSSIHSDGAGGGCVSPATLVSTCEGFRTVGAAAVGASDGGRRIHSDAVGLSVPPASDETGTGCVVTANAATGAGRSTADDQRVIFHEVSHATIGRLLTGAAIGGVTCEPGLDFSGLCWGPAYDRNSKFSESENVPSFCAKIGALMPQPGESRADAADVYLNSFHRIVELVAGTEGERLFMPGEPWFAVDDERQAIAYAILITSNQASALAFIEACRVESRALLINSADIVHALAAELRVARTMDGAAVDLCIERAVVAKAAADEHKRRADWRSVEKNAKNFTAEKME